MGDKFTLSPPVRQEVVMDRQYFDERKKISQSFYCPGSIRLSFFFKADSQPEVLANEHLENTAINESCFMDIKELNPGFPSFRKCSDKD